MAFENGNNIFDYCGDIFEKYREDNMILYKMLQVLDYFRGRNDYPYCTDEISKVCEIILGQGLDGLTDFLWKYIVPLGHEMYWDASDVLKTERYKDGNMIADLSAEDGERLTQNFKNDMEAFFIATTPLFEELFLGNTNCTRVNKVAVKKTYGEEKTVRFIRYDGEKFDFSVNKQDIQKIINVLSGLE